MNGRPVCALICLALTAGGCAAQRSAIVSPYQNVLAAYYRAIETQAAVDLDAADREASAILTKDAGDHTARILRANVSLTRLRLNAESGDSGQIKRKILTDLTIVSAGVGNVGESADWVLARGLVVMGDLLVLDGNSAVATALESGKTDTFKLSEAKSMFDAARQYYGGAVALGDQKKADATAGLAREGANGRQGHLTALRGTLNVLDSLDPAQSQAMVGVVRSDLIKAWEAQFTTGAVTAAAPGTLSFNAAEHSAAQALYATLGNVAQKELAAWCSTNKGLSQKATERLTGEERKAVEAGNAILRRVLSLSESEALHAYVAKLLRDSGDNTASNSKVLFWLERDLKQSCSA